MTDHFSLNGVMLLPTLQGFFCFVLFQIMAVYSCNKYNIYGSANTLKKKCSLSIQIHLIDLLVGLIFQ